MKRFQYYKVAAATPHVTIGNPKKIVKSVYESVSSFQKIHNVLYSLSFAFLAIPVRIYFMRIFY